MKKQRGSLKRPILSFTEFVKQVNVFCWTDATDEELKIKLLKCASKEVSYTFSLLKEIILRCTGKSLFDTQIVAAYSMFLGHVVELPTGEGKTLSAVVTATVFALLGNTAHILTFNDYLAKRDYNESLPIFEFCGLSSAYITENNTLSERKSAYQSSVLYLTVKEAGFDFLRNFLCNDTTKLLENPFQIAIVDEADSILIDEARTPLVLAGTSEVGSNDTVIVNNAVNMLTQSDVTFDTSKSEIWLTETGIEHIETILQIENLYDKHNVQILSLLYAALEAKYLIHNGKDYIVKENEICVVDEPTGRIAYTRKFPDLLHRAIETKERIKNESVTCVYNSIPIQFFLLQYTHLCGMTGTAKDAAKEIKTMYGLEVDIIPPHTPCKRIDHDDCICDSRQEKISAIIHKVRRVNKKGQPVLIGTRSVEESEEIAAQLMAANLKCCILNARNDEMEANLIAHAGESYRITVSTNMAGRGVDIKLGGQNEEENKFVMASGGLFVVGAGINRCKRIDNQLRGRAGRQGDPGESKFYISLDEPVLAPYFSKLKKQRGQIHRKVRFAQACEEGSDAQNRYALEKYGVVIEEQRRFISDYRNNILCDNKIPAYFKVAEPEMYQQYVANAGIAGVTKAEVQLTLYFINQHWADYLSTMENVRNGIHLTILGGLEPIVEYHRMAAEAFSAMMDDIEKDVILYMKTCEITEDGIDMQSEGLIGATTTWTYAIDESKNQFSRLPHMMKTLSYTVRGPLFTFGQILSAIRKK